mmetsp:Transcript_37581/g.75265  ORF Transcript_37581/g.75265 Transcript_37581/m.75265 type:complete len:264 (+) Transcript_37581:1-792(+)
MRVWFLFGVVSSILGTATAFHVSGFAKFSAVTVLTLRNHAKTVRGWQRFSITAQERLTEVRVNLAPGLSILTLQEAGWEWVQNENKYGNMVWPGAKAVSKALVGMELEGRRVLELGAGSGLCSIAAASLGASVLATDLNEEPLQLLQMAASRQNLKIDVEQFDILGPMPLPRCDIVIAADCIYNKQLGEGMARRVVEAKCNGAEVLIGSSVKRPGYELFLSELGGMGYGKDTFASCTRTRDFSSPLIFLDVFRGNFEQEIVRL